MEAAIFFFRFVRGKGREGKEDMQKRKETNEVCVHGREMKYACVCVRRTTDKSEGKMGEGVLYLRNRNTP